MTRTNGAPPVFVVGSVRSGTTLLRLMLDRHPDLAIPSESQFIPVLWKRRKRYGAGGRIENREAWLKDVTSQPAVRFWSISVEDVRAELDSVRPLDFARAIEVIFCCYARRNGKSRWGDKTPQYVDRLALIGTLFPNARFVHVIRDGRDVALSMIDLNRLHQRAATTAFFWARSIRRGRHVGQRLGPERYMEVRYEWLLDDPEGELRRVSEFLDLPYDPVMLRHDPDAILHLPDRHRPIHSRLALPLTKGLRDWRHEMNPKEIEEFEAIAGRELEALGYERVTEHSVWTWARAWVRFIGFGRKYLRRQIRKGASTLTMGARARARGPRSC
jgi:hypothetical protein